MVDRQALLEAINHLVLDDDAEKKFHTITELAKLPATVPVRMTDEASCFNSMLDLARSDSQAYLKVLDLIDSKRIQRGWPPLRKPEPEGFNRNEYQRDFMHQKRQRERRAVEIENMLRPARDKLIGNARLEFMRRASAKWKDRRDALVNAAREGSGGTLSKEQVTAILKRFWEQVDLELDEAEESMRRKLRGG